MSCTKVTKKPFHVSTSRTHITKLINDNDKVIAFEACKVVHFVANYDVT